jgi:thiol-disulfide isomerase/thioredoxin
MRVIVDMTSSIDIYDNDKHPLAAKFDSLEDDESSVSALTPKLKLYLEKRQDKEPEQLPDKGKSKKRMLYFSFLIAFVVIAASLGAFYIDKKQVSSRATMAPDFTLKDLNGDAFQLRNSTGKVVVLDFMATWCPSCRSQLPHDKTIVEKYGDKIILVTIDVDPTESEEALRTLARQFSYSSWVWARDTANLAQSYGVSVIPKTVIVDKNSYIRFQHTGVIDASGLIEEIDQLLS